MTDPTPMPEGGTMPTREGRNTFNPSEHLVKLKGKDYLEVKWRIAWLRDEHPDARIRTELVERGDDYAIFKAHVLLPTGGEATGWGSETAHDFGDYLEKAECVPLESEILTRQGFKRYDQLRLGEEVLAYDPADDRCHWTPLQGVTVHEALPLARLHGNRFDVVCTPNHSWAVSRPTAQRLLAEAQALQPTDSLILAAPEPSGSHLFPLREAALLGCTTPDGTVRRRCSDLALEPIGTGPAWCPTTRYGTWVMRQNGQVLITGNTKSLGRALAALGYGTQFTDEHDFGAEQGRVVDAPVERPARRQPTTASAQPANGGGNLASPAQLKAIYAIASQDLHWSPEQTDEHIHRMTRKRMTELAKGEASRVIDSLKQLVANQ